MNQPPPEPISPPAAPVRGRELRADARRNRERVVAAAQQLFATEGLGVSLDEVARRAGVGPGTVHRHFPTKEALYLAVSIDQIAQLVAEASTLTATDDPAALFTLLSRMIANGIENILVKSALSAIGFDLRTAAPELAHTLTAHVETLLARARTADLARDDVTPREIMALIAGALHAAAYAGEPSPSHLGAIILDGLRPQVR
ncbi:TetR/AcrR family transcriptional regulator [Nocardia sp. NPDC059240]|uniref:TetR/AcrR family transcriptional regulator n=1 Tax=Nocardia sp. NPDC059240 TaxID=3346786 RepID=UPI0036A5E4CE